MRLFSHDETVVCKLNDIADKIKATEKPLILCPEFVPLEQDSIDVIVLESRKRQHLAASSKHVIITQEEETFDYKFEQRYCDDVKNFEGSDLDITPRVNWRQTRRWEPKPVHYPGSVHIPHSVFELATAHDADIDYIFYPNCFLIGTVDVPYCFATLDEAKKRCEEVLTCAGITWCTKSNTFDVRLKKMLFSSSHDQHSWLRCRIVPFIHPMSKKVRTEYVSTVEAQLTSTPRPLVDLAFSV